MEETLEPVTFSSIFTINTLGVYRAMVQRGRRKGTDAVVLCGKCAKIPRLGKRNL
jgi:hypothetical protein